MSLEKVADDLWTPHGIVSTFAINFNHSAPGKNKEKASLSCSGLGWRFSCAVDPSSRTMFLADDGSSTSASGLSIFFDPHLVRDTKYGRLSIVIDARGLIADNEASCTVFITLPFIPGPLRPPTDELIGRYFFNPDKPPAATLSITVHLADAPIALPRSLGTGLQRVLVDSMAGKDMVDLKFYLFSRRKGFREVTCPKHVYARAALLEGHSDCLDSIISGGDGFGESAVVDLHNHTKPGDAASEYDYMSDSDLDEEEQSPEIGAVGASQDVSSSPPVMPPISEDLGSGISAPAAEAAAAAAPPNGMARPGRVIPVGGTAYKTWNALIFYLYTNKISFTQNPSPIQEIPTCSAKSMYRLADKLGLEPLKALAFTAVKAHLTTENIVREVFSTFTCMYSEVQEAQVTFALDNFEAIQGELDAMLERVCQGEYPAATDVLRRLVKGRNASPRPWSSVGLFGPRTPSPAPSEVPMPEEAPPAEPEVAPP
ncbi:hypothetical protein MKEN_00635000 [Mycena kentingensis (nom. inval.)]|nr:hypothetical protein MKEN_00635000 [Mycena kentingensis (nom. inval.)]